MQESGYDNTTVFNDAVYTLSSLSAPIKGNLQEFIIFNSVLSNAEIDNVKSYLNTKYKIY
mgnify:CR=1 FL=1